MYALTGRECFYYILRQWKRLLLIVIVCGLVLGSYKGVNEFLHWNENKNIQEQAALNYEHDYSYVVSLADVYNVQIRAKQEERAVLQEFSITNNLGDIDSSVLYCAEADLFFDSTLPDGSYYPVSADIIEQFRDKIYAVTDWETVAAYGSVDVSFARSTFACRYNEESTSLELSILGYSYDKSVDMMNIILTNCDDIEADFEEQYSGLHMNVSNQSCDVTDSSDVVEMYSNIIDRITEIDEEIVTMQDQVNTLAYPAAPSSLPYGLQVSIKILKYALLGAVIGAVVSLVLLYLSFYLNGKIHSTEEFEFYTGSFVLPMLRSRGLSYKIAVCENHGMVYGSDEAVDRLLTNVVSANPGVESLVFTGTGVDNELSKIKEIVRTNNHGIKNFVFAPEIMTDIDAFSALKENAYVVVVERIDCVSVIEVKKEVEQIRLSGNRVVGALLVR